MARPGHGQVLERNTKRGRVYALRFHAYGARQYVTLGSNEDGWNRQRAQRELENVLVDVRRGIWKPTLPEPGTPPPIDPTFHEFSSAWLAEIAPSLRPRTVEDYTWALSYHLLPFFAKHRLAQITVAEVDRYRSQKVSAERLSATSINKTLTRLGQILDVAEERELIARNPMRVNRRRRKLRVANVRRSYIDKAAHVRALLDAAGRLDREARADQATPRRAILATLALAGLRIGELLDMRWRDVDLASGTLLVGRSKTAAGVRDIALLPLLRDELAALKATRDPRPDDLVFGTTRGNRQTATNVRQRVLGRSIARANEQLGQGGWPLLPDGLTLHSLRRTYASLLFAIGRTAPEVMAQLGHADARLTLRIYAQAMSQEPGERERLQALVDGGSLGTKRHWSQSANVDVPLGDDPLVSESAEFAATSSMEPDGLEPSTSCLQSRRSPS
jgi:integrase